MHATVMIISFRPQLIQIGRCAPEGCSKMCPGLSKATRLDKLGAHLLEDWRFRCPMTQLIFRCRA